MPEWSEKVEKVLTTIMQDMEGKIASGELSEDDPAATSKIIAEFGLTSEEFVRLCEIMTLHFISERIPMQTGIQLCMMTGMLIGRDMDQELRHEAGL